MSKSLKSAKSQRAAPKRKSDAAHLKSSTTAPTSDVSLGTSGRSHLTTECPPQRSAETGSSHQLTRGSVEPSNQAPCRGHPAPRSSDDATTESRRSQQAPLSSTTAPLSARGKATPRFRAAPASARKAGGTTVSTRKRINDAAAPREEARTAPTAPPQTSARLGRRNVSANVRDVIAAPRYLEPTISHTIYATTLKEENTVKSDGAEADALSSVAAPIHTAVPSTTVAPARRKAPVTASPLVHVSSPIHSLNSTLSSTTSALPPRTAGNNGKLTSPPSVKVPGSKSTASASSSLSNRSTPGSSSAEAGTSALRRGVVGPATGSRRGSMISSARSSMGGRPPECLSTAERGLMTEEPIPPLPEWRRSPPKSILKGAGGGSECNSVRSRSPCGAVPPGWDGGGAAADSCLEDRLAASASRSTSMTDQRRRCVRFDEQNILATATPDTRAFAEDGPGQVRGGSVDPNDLNKTRHLRSPQARGIQARGTGMGRGGGWGQDSAWFDNQFGLTPKGRHSPPPAASLLNLAPTSSDAPPRSASSAIPAARNGSAAAVPVRTTFKSNPFAATGSVSSSPASAAAAPTTTVTVTTSMTRVTTDSRAGEAGSTQAGALDSALPHTDALSSGATATRVETDGAVREHVFLSTTQVFDSQTRKPLLSSYRHSGHFCTSTIAPSETAADAYTNDDMAHLVEAPMSPTERQLLDALAKSALSAHARREVYIAPDAESRSALESQGSLQISSSHQDFYAEAATISHETTSQVPASESRGLQRFLQGSASSVDAEGELKSAASADDCFPTGAAPLTDVDAPFASPLNATASTDAGDTAHVPVTSADSQGSSSVYASQMNYTLPSSMSTVMATSSTACRAGSGALVLRVSSPSSLSSSFSTSGRPTIVSTRPPRPSASPSLSQERQSPRSSSQTTP